ncbi:MAG: tyrosine-type recombinase/integrase, partial [Chloroflexi bacterium]|nr:tyrosine-type recombinase/integrase [Chloroflexota bacterium]
THSRGRPFPPDSVGDAFGKLARRLGRSVTFHGLRHVHASVLLQQGVSLKIVSERSGHSSVAITSGVYSHVAPGMGKTAAQEFDRALSG